MNPFFHSDGHKFKKKVIKKLKTIGIDVDFDTGQVQYNNNSKIVL